MEDLAHALSLFKNVPPSISPEEQEILDKLKQIYSPEQKSADFENLQYEPELLQYLPEPGPLESKEPIPPSKHVYETPDQIRVDLSGITAGAYASIQDAINNSADGATIIVSGSRLTETVTVSRPVHFISESQTRAVNCKFQINASTTFRGFAFESEDESFLVNSGDVAFQLCSFDYHGNISPFSTTGSLNIDFDQTVINAPNIIEANSNSIVTFNQSTINGTVNAFKADISFYNCNLNGQTDSALVATSSSIRTVYCRATGCGSGPAFVVRDRSSLKMNDTEFSQVNGSGIQVHGYSTMRATNILISSCTKAGVTLSMESTAIINGSTIKENTLAGIEVIGHAILEVNETWFAENKGSSVLVDRKSVLKMTRCHIVGGLGHGIEASTGSNIKVLDTKIEKCKLDGVLMVNSKLDMKTSEITGCEKPNLFVDESSFIEITGCHILNGKHYGVSAKNGSLVNMNACFINHNEKSGLKFAGCLEVKLNHTCVHQNVRGGLLIRNTKLLAIDDCIVSKNSLILMAVESALISQTYLVEPSTLPAADGESANKKHHLEILNESHATFEDNFLMHANLLAKNGSSLKMRGNSMEHVRVVGMSLADISMERNEISSSHQFLQVKERSKLMFFGNTIRDVARLKQKSNTAWQIKQKVIEVKDFSTGKIEANIIQGDYDYAIYIDGQCKMDTKGNKIQCGKLGAIMYSGVSSGSCTDNDIQNPHGHTSKQIEFCHGSTQTRDIDSKPMP